MAIGGFVIFLACCCWWELKIGNKDNMVNQDPLIVNNDMNQYKK